MKTKWWWKKWNIIMKVMYLPFDNFFTRIGLVVSQKLRRKIKQNWNNKTRLVLNKESLEGMITKATNVNGTEVSGREEWTCNVRRSIARKNHHVYQFELKENSYIVQYFLQLQGIVVPFECHFAERLVGTDSLGVYIFSNFRCIA